MNNPGNTDLQEKAKARLLESRLLAPSGRGGASSRNLEFAFSCMSVHGCHLFSRTRTTVHPRGDPRPDKVHASPLLPFGKRPPLLVSTLMYVKVGVVRRNRDGKAERSLRVEVQVCVTVALPPFSLMKMMVMMIAPRL